MVRILLENRCQIDSCDSEGRTALRAAVFSGHDHIARLLIKYGADGNKISFNTIYSKYIFSGLFFLNFSLNFKLKIIIII